VALRTRWERQSLRHGLPADRHAGQSHKKRCGQPRRRSDPACDWGGSSSYQALQVGVVKKSAMACNSRVLLPGARALTITRIDCGPIRCRIQSRASIVRFEPDPRRVRLQYRPCPGDQWELADPREQVSKSIVARVTNGWQIGGILKVNDGAPLTPTLGSGGDPLGEKSSDPFDFPNRVTGPGCDTATNPRNPNNYIKTEWFRAPTALLLLPPNACP